MANDYARRVINALEEKSLETYHINIMDEFDMSIGQMKVAHVINSMITGGKIEYVRLETEKKPNMGWDSKNIYIAPPWKDLGRHIYTVDKPDNIIFINGSKDLIIDIRREVYQSLKKIIEVAKKAGIQATPLRIN